MSSNGIYDPSLYRDLDNLPTLAVGQADDLKIDTRRLTVGVNLPEGVTAIQVWTSRVMPGHVTAERCLNGRYEDTPDAEQQADIDLAVAAARQDGMLS